MIREEIKNIDASDKNIRNFGLIFAVLSFFLAFYFYRRAAFDYKYLVALGVIFLLAGLLSLKLLKPLYKIWMTFSILLGTIVNFIILSIVYFLVVTPIGIVLKMVGKDSLSLKLNKMTHSYWNYRDKAPVPLGNYERQF